MVALRYTMQSERWNPGHANCVCKTQKPQFDFCICLEKHDLF